ncbi:hypothetical protein B0J14DRAFT_657995 [Halenospora varia]|nr:hypothetical protein B0J14DRAFT_657995 [Halenospora varia]
MAPATPPQSVNNFINLTIPTIPKAHMEVIDLTTNTPPKLLRHITPHRTLRIPSPLSINIVPEPSHFISAIERVILTTAEAEPESTVVLPLSLTTTFHGFKDLPFELRVKIWKLVPESQVLEVECAYKHERWVCLQESAPKPSPLLSVNKESREEYLRHWLPFLPLGATKFTFTMDEGLNIDVWSNFEDGVMPMAYFNPMIDTMYIGPSTASWQNMYIERITVLFDSVTWLKDIQYVACEFDTWATSLGYSLDDCGRGKKLGTFRHDDLLGEHLRTTFPNLKCLDVVIGDIVWDLMGAAFNEGGAMRKKPIGPIELFGKEPGREEQFDENYGDFGLDEEETQYHMMIFGQRIDSLKAFDLPKIDIKVIHRGGYFPHCWTYPKAFAEGTGPAVDYPDAFYE